MTEKDVVAHLRGYAAALVMIKNLEDDGEMVIAEKLRRGVSFFCECMVEAAGKDSELLMRHYVRGERWKEIAAALHIGERYVSRRARKALAAVAAVMSKKIEDQRDNKAAESP